MGDKKLKIRVNIMTGKYIFDDGDEVIEMSMNEAGANISEVMKSTSEDMMEEYGFSEDMISRADPILYTRLLEYDNKKKTSYATKYLNMLAKEVEEEPSELKEDYQNRCFAIRGKALKDAGIELSYTMLVLKEMKHIPFFDRMKLVKMINRQKENGAIIEYPDLENPAETKTKTATVVTSNVANQTENNEPVVTMDVPEEDDLDKIQMPQMRMPKFLKDVFNRRKPEEVTSDETLIVDESVRTARKPRSFKPSTVTEKDEDVISFEALLLGDEDREEVSAETLVVDEENKKVEPDVTLNLDLDEDVREDEPTQPPVSASAKPEQPKAKKAVSRRKNIQASKKALRESRKMKNIYKNKVSSVIQPKKSSGTPPKTKAQKTEEYKRKHKAPTTQQKPTQETPERKELQFIEIRNGKMVGVDENRPSAIVKTFTIQVPKKENAVQRFTRKLKDKADSIRNKVPITKERFRKLAISGAVGIVAIAAVAAIFPRISIATTSVPMGVEYDSGIEIQAYDGVEQVVAKDIEEKGSKAETTSLAGSEVKLESSYIRDASAEEISARGVTSKTENSAIKETKSEDAKAVAAESEVESVTAINRSEDSNEYLSSVRVGSRMTIDSGKYFETPEGTGNYGHFENHQGEAKIIDKIGIAATDRYISISTDDFSLLELKQMYPDAKFAYHIVDEEGHVLGWLTSESMENAAEKQVDDGMDR